MPSHFGCLSIRSLDLSHNSLASIEPGQLSALDNLDTLSLAYNLLTDIHDALRVLAKDVGRSLRSLGLFGNLWPPRGVQRQVEKMLLAYY